MSAQDHLHPQQLQMFMTPTEIHAQVEPRDFSPEHAPKTWDDPDEGWGRKIRRAKGVYDPEREFAPHPGLYESIEKHGIEEPVAVAHENGALLLNGHHRVAVATDLARKGREIYVPVEHHR